MSTKEMFNDLLKKKGYTSLRDFCLQSKIDYPNMNKRVNGIRQKIEIAFIFKLANLLNESYTTIVEIFYPDEVAANRDCIRK